MKVEYFSMKGQWQENEDFLAYKFLDEKTLVAVLSDGIGGLSLGAMAAKTATNAICDYCVQHYGESNIQELLKNAFKEADDKIRAVSLQFKSNMGTATTAIIIEQEKLHCSWLGNVRIFRMIKNDPLQLNIDHVIHIGYGRTALSRCLKGIGTYHPLPYITDNLQQGTTLYLCTDGLYQVAHSALSTFSMQELETLVNLPNDDASAIKISL